MSASADVLFRPFRFGKVTLPNRIAMAPMTRNRSPKGIPTDDVAAYYRRRAEGGVGLLITEATVVGHKAANGYPQVPAFDGEGPLAGWKKVVDAVHGAGGYVIPQLWHVGSIRKSGMEPDPSVPGYAPSPIPHPSYKGKGETPKEMTKEDIREVVAAFGRSAGHAERLGFDGIEIHGAHAYLIDQFFWETTNQRTDEYGGSFEKRLRFGIEVIEACRAAVSKDFPIVLRFSQWKQGDYNWKIAKDAKELERFLSPLSKAGADIFHCSTRRYWESEFEGSDLNLAGWTKKLTGKPTITVGSVGLDTDFIKAFATQAKNMPIDNLLERMARDEFDMVAVGRALLADPEWAKKVRERREAEIKPFTPQAVGVLW